ncbi:hypothetical protein GCM10007424_22700 [Flavobacterium suaedae]|uniref:Esterase n=1 Tax=Flavobacterium suaedae TaxID=1767027 RepID=A0ABQ1K2R4_9FLAO|nr:alpha/beta hydrolase-fold protein [Flavobacterium suaedae]GGB82129.1 hypothetical protein GCM10007424_22700 [Flavobacterium suaedae]
MKTILVTITLLASLLLSAQEKWVIKSEYLSKNDTVLIFKPDSYTSSQKYPLVYLLHGYSENYEQWNKTCNLKKLANTYNMVFVCPDGFVSWYIDSPYKKESQMESFFFKVLVPKVHNNLSINSKNIFITGLSMGGYGAMRYGLLHPEYFNSFGSMSGALNLDYNLLKKVSSLFFNNNRITNDITFILGNYKKNDWGKYSISNIIKQSLQSTEFIMDCGREDIFYNTNTAIAKKAEQLKIPYVFISQPGNHNTEYWSKTLELHLLYFSKKIKKGID